MKLRNPYSLAIALLVLISSGAVFAADAVAEPSAAAKTYAAKCASCHGKSGTGNPAMAKVFKVEPSALDLTVKATTDKTDDVLIQSTTDGKGKMPAYKGKLTEGEIKDVVAYTRSLAPAEKK